MSVEDVLPPNFISKYFPQNLFPDYTLPKIDQQSLVKTGQSYIDAQKELAKELGYGEGRPTDAKQIFEERQALLADYLTKPKTKEELLAEQQAFFGDDTQKNAEIQAGLALAKYGSQVAQTPGSLLQALVAPAGGLAADLSKVAATKSAVERAAKYLMILPRHSVFISTSGYGFSEEAMRKQSTATAKFVAIARYGHKRLGLEKGVGFSLNEGGNAFKDTFRDWFEYLISKETDYYS